MLNKVKKSLLILTSSLLILIGLYLVCNYYLSYSYEKEHEKRAIEKYYETDNIQEEVRVNDDNRQYNDLSLKYEYIAILKIPKIKLERGLVNPNSIFNDIKYNVEIIGKSLLQKEIDKDLVLAAHSGNSKISYFRYLDKLDINDKVELDYMGKTYTYRVSNVYDVLKTGKVNLTKNKNVNTLTLITCRYNTNRQIIVVCDLIGIS